MARRRDDPWPEKPDRWAEADRQWAEKWADDPETEGPPPPRHHSTGGGRRGGPRPSGPGVVRAYGVGMQGAGPHLGLGFQIAGAMAFFTVGGYFLDRALGTSPWGVIAGATFALVSIVALVVRLANEATAKTRREKDEPGRRKAESTGGR